jgi:hypothetical protein
MAIIGGIFPFTAKVDATVWNRIYEKLSPSPIPKCNPIPPFVFLEERDTPITVRMNDANDMAIRL